MTRDEMIRQLVLDRLTAGDDIDRHIQLGQMLEIGFAGFRNFTDSQLKAAVLQLEMSLDAEKNDAYFDCFPQDDIFDSSLSAGHGIAMNISLE